MSAPSGAIDGFGLLVAQGLLTPGECLGVIGAGGLPSGGAARSALALALAGAVSSMRLRRGAAAGAARQCLWAMTAAGPARAVLLAAADPSGLLRAAECEAIAREVIGWRLQRRRAHRGG